MLPLFAAVDVALERPPAAQAERNATATAAHATETSVFNLGSDKVVRVGYLPEHGKEFPALAARVT